MFARGHDFSGSTFDALQDRASQKPSSFDRLQGPNTQGQSLTNRSSIAQIVGENVGGKVDNGAQGQHAREEWRVLKAIPGIGEELGDSVCCRSAFDRMDAEL